MLTRRLLFASVIPTPYIPPLSVKTITPSTKKMKKNVIDMSDKFTEPVYKFRSNVEILNDYAFAFDSYIVQDEDESTFIHFTKTKWFDVVNKQFVEQNEKKVYVVGEDFM